MQRGVLLEVDGRYAVVLTPRGEFKRVPVPQGTWEIGDEVSFAEPKQIPWVRWGMVAAAAVLMLVFAPVGYQTWALAQPAAVITIDINPSLELTLNVRDQVLKAEALNDDGQLVLTGVDWKRQPVDAVIGQVTAKAVAAGKLNPDDAGSAVLVAVTPAKGKSLDAQHEEKLLTGSKAAVNGAVAKEARSKKVEPKTNVAVLAATPAERDEAEKEGLTPGKFLLFKELQAQVPEIKAEELKDQGPGKLLHSLGINPGQIFGKAEEHHGGQKKSVPQVKQGAGEEPVSPVTGRPNPDSDKGGSGKDGKDKDKADNPKADKPKAENPDRGEKADKERDGKENAAPDKQKRENETQDREKEKGRSSNGGSEKKSNSSSLDLEISVQASEQPRAVTPGAEPSVGQERKPAEGKSEAGEQKHEQGKQQAADTVEARGDSHNLGGRNSSDRVEAGEDSRNLGERNSSDGVEAGETSPESGERKPADKAGVPEKHSKSGEQKQEKGQQKQGKGEQKQEKSDSKGKD